MTKRILPLSLVAVAACGTSSGSTTSTYGDAVATSDASATTIDTTVTDRSGALLARLHYDPLAKSAGVRIGDTTTNIALPALTPSQANDLAYSTWKFDHNHAASSPPREGYITCEPALICGTFGLDGYRCSACAIIDANCETGLQVECVSN